MRTLEHNATPQTISKLVHTAKALHDSRAMGNDGLIGDILDEIDNLYTTVSFMTPTTPECLDGLIHTATDVVHFLSEQDTSSPDLDVYDRKANRCFDSALDYCGLSDTQFARLSSIRDKLSEYDDKERGVSLKVVSDGQ